MSDFGPTRKAVLSTAADQMQETTSGFVQASYAYEALAALVTSGWQIIPPDDEVDPGPEPVVSCPACWPHDESDCSCRLCDGVGKVTGTDATAWIVDHPESGLLPGNWPVD